MLRIILTAWTDSIINVLMRQNWERFYNNSRLIRGISNRCLQSFGKGDLRPFPLSYLLSRFRSTLHHNRTSLTTEGRQFWRTSWIGRSKHGAYSLCRPVLLPTSSTYLY